MKNIIFAVSTLQESDSFFMFASGLKDKNKNINIISIFDSPDFYKQLKKNKSLFNGFKKLGRVFFLKKKNKTFQKIYSFFWLVNIIFNILKLKNPVLFTGGNFHNVYRISFQLISKIKKGKSLILMPHSFLWDYQYKEFRKRTNFDSFKRNYFHKLLNLNINGFIFYNNKQLGYAKLLQRSLKFKSKQICKSGLGLLTSFYNNFFQNELSKLKKEKYIKNRIYTIICGSYAHYLLKEDSQERILKTILKEILKLNKKNIILLRKHPKDTTNKSHVLDALKEIPEKKNVFFTNLHPQILSKISSRVICYARTNVMTDIFNSKKIDCSEYRKIDLIRNNGKAPGNYGYGVIYINPRKKEFIKNLKNVLVNDKCYKNKKIYMEEKKLLEKNFFNYKKIENFINNV